MESLERVVSGVTQNSETSLKNLQKGIPYWNLIDSPPIEPKHILQLQVAFEENYKTNYSNSFMEMLANLMRKENWSVRRLQDTLEWFIKTNPYPSFSAANWFGYNIKLYPYSWYLEQLHKGVKNSDIDAYKVKGKVYYRLKDGNELPFEKLDISGNETEGTKFRELTKEESENFILELKKAVEAYDKEKNENKSYEW